MERTYKDRKLTQAIVVTDLLNGQSVTTMQSPYLLTEADFLRLQGIPPITAALATILFSAVVGYAVSLGPKITPLFNGGKSQLTPGEIVTMLAGIALSILFYVIGFCFPNEKKKTMKKISNHFDNEPPSSHIVGGKK
ncbi:MAG: hypothetical protein HOP01_01665 [Gallionella sp.]|nr:hypothetical protein [Gallionella sp.]